MAAFRGILHNLYSHIENGETRHRQDSARRRCQNKKIRKGELQVKVVLFEFDFF